MKRTLSTRITTVSVFPTRVMRCHPASGKPSCQRSKRGAHRTRSCFPRIAQIPAGEQKKSHSRRTVQVYVDSEISVKQFRPTNHRDFRLDVPFVPVDPGQRSRLRGFCGNSPVKWIGSRPPVGAGERRGSIPVVPGPLEPGFVRRRMHPPSPGEDAGCRTSGPRVAERAVDGWRCCGGRHLGQHPSGSGAAGHDFGPAPPRRSRPRNPCWRRSASAAEVPRRETRHKPDASPTGSTPRTTRRC